MRVLLADDHALVRKSLQAMLVAAGVDVCAEAADGEDAPEVVIKVARSASLSSEAQRRLEHEAAALRQASSPWRAPLLAAGREDGLLYPVMPFIPGTTLEARLAQGALPVVDTLEIGSCLLSALEDAHGRGVLHRDVKPAVVAGIDSHSAPPSDSALRPEEERLAGYIASAAGAALDNAAGFAQVLATRKVLQQTQDRLRAVLDAAWA